MFFAEELPLAHVDSGSAVIIVIVIQTVLILVAAAGGIMAMVIAARRKPSIEAEFPTKAEMNNQISQLRSEVQHSDKRNEELFKSVFLDLKTLNNSVNAGFQDLHRSLGRLEHK